MTEANERYFEDLGFAENAELPPPLSEAEEGLLKPSRERRLGLRSLADVQPRQVRWLVPGLIPLRTITLIAGVGGLGKSTWLAARSAEVSRGEYGEAGDVLILSFEDAAAEVLRPRVEAAGGALDRVHEVVVGGIGEQVQLPNDIEELGRLVRETNAMLVIIDPVVAAISTQLDAHKDQHVRVVLAELTAMAEATNCAIAIVGHLNKTPSRDAYIRIGGSVAFWNASRSVVLVTEDPEEPEALRLITQRKDNYSRLSPPQRHRIEEVILPGTVDLETGEPIVTSRMTFIEVAADVDAADVLAPRVGSDEAPKEVSATRFLLVELAGGDWQESAEIKERGEAAGIADRTLQRAMKDMNIEVDRRGFPSVTYWRLPSRASVALPIPLTDGATVDSSWLSQADASEALVAPTLLGGTTDGATQPERAEHGLVEALLEDNERAVLAEAQNLVDADEAKWIENDPGVDEELLRWLGTAPMDDVLAHFDEEGAA